jgi:hypothetical protein
MVTFLMGEITRDSKPIPKVETNLTGIILNTKNNNPEVISL